MIPWALQCCNIVSWLQGWAGARDPPLVPVGFWGTGRRAQVMSVCKQGHRDSLLQRLGAAGEALGSLAKLLWKLVLLIQPLDTFAFWVSGLDLHCSKSCGLELRLWTSIWHRSLIPLDFLYLAMAHSWLCHKLWPWVSLLLCRSQYYVERRFSEPASLYRDKCLEATLHFPKSVELWVQIHQHWLRPACTE